MRLSRFIHQKPYERIVYKVRRSLVTLLPALLGFVLLLLLPGAVYWLLTTLFPTLLLNPLLRPILILFGSLYLLCINLFFYSYFIDFYLDLLVVTNDRLVDVEQRGLFARSISEVDLFQIQDITSEVHGVFASLFNYGVLKIQTAGATQNFIIPDVPHPHHLRQAILDLAAADRQYHNK